MHGISSLGPLNPGSINPGSINHGSITPGSVNPGALNPGPINPGPINPLPELEPPVAVLGNSTAIAAPLPAVGDKVSSTSSSSAVPAPTASVRSGLTEGGAARGGPHPGGGGPAPFSLFAQEQLASNYPMTVSGQQYPADYTASVANVPGMTATSSSELAAETTLQLRIDELV